MITLIKRNIKAYTRDRTAFLMSFLSVLILLMLNQIFLGKLQVDGIKASMQLDEVPSAVLQMVNLWLVAGITTVVCMTSTLGTYSVMIKDREDKIDEDFAVSAFPHWKIELAYMIAAVCLGVLITLVCFFAGLMIYVGFDSFSLFSFVAIGKIMGLIFLGCLLSSSLVMPILAVIKTSSAFSSVSAITGSVIGFLAGVYIAIGAVGDLLGQVMTWFPLTQINTLLKTILMEKSMVEVFKGAPSSAIETYKENYGITLSAPNGHVLSELEMCLYVCVCIIGFIGLYLIIKNGHRMLKRKKQLK